jgi:hypothetical protein
LPFNVLFFLGSICSEILLDLIIDLGILLNFAAHTILTMEQLFIVHSVDMRNINSVDRILVCCFSEVTL